jgi:hypothetical protein
LKGRRKQLLNAKDNTTDEQTPYVITRKIGSMTYKVNVHFSKTSRETMQDKMKRIILNEFDKEYRGL